MIASMRAWWGVGTPWNSLLVGCEVNGALSSQLLVVCCLRVQGKRGKVAGRVWKGFWLCET